MDAFEGVPPKYKKPICFPSERHGKPELGIYLRSAVQEFVKDAMKADTEGRLQGFVDERFKAAAAVNEVGGFLHFQNGNADFDHNS